MQTSIIMILMMLLFSSCAMFFKTRYMERLNVGTLKDGMYSGEDSTLLCSVKLNVEIKDNKIKNIKIMDKFFT